MSTSFTERVRAQMRDEVLDAAAASVVDGGWQRLRMQSVAEQVGVSRRTLYNEFGSKPQLARALVERSTESLSATVRGAFERADDPTSGWRDAVLAVLRDADTDPVLSAVLTDAAGPDFLPLLTSEGSHAIEYSTRQLAENALARWPDLEPRRTGRAAHATVRLVISHFLRPAGSREDAADEIAEVVLGYLRAS